jgi:hypothetical protein
MAGPPFAPGFRDLALHAALSGLCPLIPLPFLDDWALDAIRRRMVREALRRHGLEPSAAELEVLTGIRERRGGCLWTLFRGLVLRLPRRTFRRLLVFLALKDCADRASETFHEGYLLGIAVAKAELADGTPESARRVRRAVRSTCAEIDPRPLNQALLRVFRGRRPLLREPAAALGRALRRSRRALRRHPAGDPGGADAALQAQEPLIAPLVDGLARALWHEQGYLAALSQVFESKLSAGSGPARP